MRELFQFRTFPVLLGPNGPIFYTPAWFLHVGSNGLPPGFVVAGFLVCRRRLLRIVGLVEYELGWVFHILKKIEPPVARLPY